MEFVRANSNTFADPNRWYGRSNHCNGFSPYISPTHRLRATQPHAGVNLGTRTRRHSTLYSIYHRGHTYRRTCRGHCHVSDIYCRLRLGRRHLESNIPQCFGILQRRLRHNGHYRSKVCFPYKIRCKSRNKHHRYNVDCGRRIGLSHLARHRQKRRTRQTLPHSKQVDTCYYRDTHRTTGRVLLFCRLWQYAFRTTTACVAVCGSFTAYGRF